MVRVSQTPYHFELKEIQFKLIFCFISINSALICAGQSVTNVCSICTCDQYQTSIYCFNRTLTSVPKAIPATVENLYLIGNQIRNIERDAFKDLINLKTLDLSGNKIRNIERDAFKDLVNLKTLDLGWNQIRNIEKDAFKHLINLKTLSLWDNRITNIPEGVFLNLVGLEILDLWSNEFLNIPEGAFKNLVNLEELDLSFNGITNIPEGVFPNLVNLEELYLNNNQIKTYEDGAFLFLPNITYIELRGNDNMTCGCHLPAMVDYLERTYSKQVTVHGKCRNKQMELINILEYSECKDYSLFQRKLQCQTCSGITCNDSEVTSCPGEEPVCMNRISMSGVTLMSDKSCSTYRECVAAKKNSTFPCNKLTSGTSCVTCCTGDLCNKNEFIDYALFQRKLQCQTCSGITCNDSEVTSCPGEEPVCMNRISMSGVTLKSDKSCSTYRECVAAKKNSTFPCNKLTNGTSCVTCCTGDLCNKNDSIDYSLFQRKLQCQTCSGITCNDSEVTSCPGEEPVCMNRISMSGVTLKSDKSCSTYRECVAAKKNSTFPCNKLTSGTSCVTCCTGDLCTKNDSIDYSLFQRTLQCQTCSGITCNDSEVTSCPGEEPVCMNRISMSGVTLKSDKSCSTYRECVAAKKNSTFPCNKLTSGTSCVTCCTGDLCNKNDSIVKGKSWQQG